MTNLLLQTVIGTMQLLKKQSLEFDVAVQDAKARANGFCTLYNLTSVFTEDHAFSYL